METDTAARTKMIDRVRALFTKAASTEYGPEAEAFEAKALALMVEWEIAERDIADAGHGPERHNYDTSTFGNAQWGASALVQWLAPVFGCHAVASSAGNRKLHTICYGTPSNVARLDTVLDHLFPQLRADIIRDRPRSRKSYAIGWADRVASRFREVIEVAYSESTALVPTNDAARQAMADDGLRTGTTGHDVNPRDVAAGERAGSDADLGIDSLPD